MSFIISFPKLLNISQCFPEFYELLQQIIESKGEVRAVMETSSLQASQTEVVDNLGTTAWLGV